MRAEINHDTLTLHFTRWERLFTRTGRVDVPLAAIAEVRPLDRPLAAATGLRSGLVVSGVLKVGAWTSLAGVRRLVAARKGVAGVRIVLKQRSAEGYDELILSSPELQAVMA
jgi:hypothetical protein